MHLVTLLYLLLKSVHSHFWPTVYQTSFTIHLLIIELLQFFIYSGDIYMEYSQYIQIW